MKTGQREKRGVGDRDQLVVLSDTSDYFKLQNRIMKDRKEKKRMKIQKSDDSALFQRGNILFVKIIGRKVWTLQTAICNQPIKAYESTYSQS